LERKNNFRFRLEAAESNYKVAKADVDAALQTVQAAEYSVRSAEATLKEAEEELRKTSIYAPMDGIVTTLLVEKGERVVGTSMMTGTDLLRLADLSRMEVLTEVNENDIVRVSLNDSALIEIDAYPDRKFKGIVTEIANSASTVGTSADQVTNFEVKILLLQSSYQDLIQAGNQYPFRPGMSASVDILTELKSNILTVPLQAVTRQADTLQQPDSAKTSDNLDEYKEIIFVLDNQKAKLTTVKQEYRIIPILKSSVAFPKPGGHYCTLPYHNKKTKRRIIRKKSNPRGIVKNRQEEKGRKESD